MAIEQWVEIWHVTMAGYHTSTSIHYYLTKLTKTGMKIGDGGEGHPTTIRTGGLLQLT